MLTGSLSCSLYQIIANKMFYNRSNHFLIVPHCTRGRRRSNEDYLFSWFRHKSPHCKNRVMRNWMCLIVQREVLYWNPSNWIGGVWVSLDIQQLASPLSLPLTGQMARHREQFHFVFLLFSKSSTYINRFFVTESLTHWHFVTSFSFCILYGWI